MNRYLGTISLEPTRSDELWKKLVLFYRSLRKTPAWWVVSSLTGDVGILTENENREIARIEIRKRTVGVLVYLRQGNSIEVYGDPERVSELAREYSDCIESTFSDDVAEIRAGSDEPASQMIMAMAEGNSKKMLRLMKSGVPPDGVYPLEELDEDDEGEDPKFDPMHTFLGIAAEAGLVEACKVLVEAGANPLASEDCPALFLAAQSGNQEATKFLRLCHPAAKGIKDTT